MFDLNNSFVECIISEQKGIIEKYNVVNRFIHKGLFEKMQITMTENELYHDSVAKWLFRINESFDSLQKNQIIFNKNRFTKNNIPNKYDVISNEIKNYIINISTYHDLILHLANQVQKINIPSDKISWKIIKKQSTSEVINGIQNVYDLLSKEVSYRNSSLHDFEFDWIKNYFSYEVVEFFTIFHFPEIKEIMKPIQTPLVNNANIELGEIKKNMLKKIQLIEIKTYLLFDDLLKIYKSKKV